MLEKRIVAFLIDIATYTVIFCMVGFMDFFVSSLEAMFRFGYYIALLFTALSLFTRDVVGGSSVGKRIVGIKVVNSDGSKANLLQLIFRNATILIWPLEAIILCVKGKRIGDFLAKTDVVLIDKTTKRQGGECPPENL